MLLLTTIPLRLLTTWKQGVSAIRAGGLLKQRLLYGALRLNPDQIRHQGAGQLLGRIVETDAVETMALNGGFHGLLAVIELTMAAAVLSMGSGGWLHAGLLLVWTGLALLIGWTYLSKRRGWMEQRMSITNDLVESMVGHRTRLAQEPREHWHDAEDRSLEHYFRSSKQMDRIAVLLSTLLPRGWLVIGIAGLALNFVRGGSSTGLLAVGLGGVLLAYSALRHLEECESVCRDLGLGDLIDRMPAGLNQMVGETGWQLSHGERSRLYIARALLQRADLVLLDESFAALDPENLRRALTCVLNRVQTLVVIAHP
jgi:ATP-binding cassette subfamily B protein